MPISNYHNPVRITYLRNVSGELTGFALTPLYKRSLKENLDGLRDTIRSRKENLILTPSSVSVFVTFPVPELYSVRETKQLAYSILGKDKIPWWRKACRKLFYK